jgi:hypothetical protein
MPARGHFANFFSAFERFHADHALSRVELVNSFVTFFEADDWDELHVAINQRLLGNASHHLSFLLSVFLPLSILIFIVLTLFSL